MICIPFVILGSILISASKATGTPVLGNRYENDLNPAITQEQLAAIESKVVSDNQVESVDVKLVTATLRIYVDMQDSLNEEEASALANSVYEAVTSTLDVNTYFTKTGTKKMYDYIDDNPELLSAPVNYTNDIRSISALDNFMYQ